MKTILITGSNGFIGTSLTSRLKKLNYNVLSFNHSDGDISECDFSKIYENVNIDHIFHLTAKTFVPNSWENPRSFYKISVDGTQNILELCRLKQISLTYISAYLYGNPEKLPISEESPINPNNPYSHSKYLTEELCKFYANFYNVSISIVRPFNIYGKNQDEIFLIPHIINQVLNEKSIIVQDLSPARDYIYIEDLTDALITLLNKKETFAIYNIGSGYEISVKEVINTIQKIAKKDKEVISKNIKRKNEIMHVVADISKAKKNLNWFPQHSFEDGIQKILTELKNEK